MITTENMPGSTYSVASSKRAAAVVAVAEVEAVVAAESTLVRHPLKQGYIKISESKASHRETQQPCYS